MPPVKIRSTSQSIKAALERLDAQAVRPLRAIAAGVSTDEDRQALAAIEARVCELRARLRSSEG